VQRKDDGIKTLIFFLTPTVMVISGLVFFPFPLDSRIKNLLYIPLFLSLLMLLSGYFGKGKFLPVLRVVGWLLFAFYWSTQINTLFYYEGGDAVNAAICTIGIYVLTYFAYKELTTDIECVPWLAATAGTAGLIYFTMNGIPILRESLIDTVTRHSALLYSLFDGNIRFDDNLIWAGYDYINGSSPTAEIIFACTAIQSMLLFVGLILPLREVSIKRRLLMLSFLIPVIYFLNLIRNASVVYLVGYRITDMNVAHNYIGKTGSLIALVFLVMVVFKYIPELYDKIICTLNLYKEEGFVERCVKGLLRR